MVKEEEVFGSRFLEVKPGWVYDFENRDMISRNIAFSKTTPLKFDHVLLKHKSLIELLDEDKRTSEFVWQKEFENFEEKNCFFMRFTSSYSETLDCLNLKSVVNGAVTKVNYKQSIGVLVCSDDENASDACFSYMKKIIEGVEAELDKKTCESCKKCFMYDGYIANKKNVKKEFISIMHCLKEISRIIDEMQNYQNFSVYSWMFLIENSMQPVVQPEEHFTNKLAVFKTKVFNTSDKENSPAQFSFGSDSFNLNQNKLEKGLKEKSSDFCIIGVHESFKRDSVAMNIPLISTVINEAKNDTTSEDVVAINSLSVVDEGLAFTKTHIAIDDKKPPTDKFPDLSAHEAIESMETENKAWLNAVTPESVNEIGDEKKSNSEDITKTSSLIIKADDALLSTDIDSNIEDTGCVTATSSSSVPVGKAEGLVDNHVKTNVFAKENKYPVVNDGNIKKKDLEKRNCKKRPTVAERISLNGPSKKLEKKNFIDYLDKKIALTVVEENGICKIDVGTKTIIVKNGKVIVLLGATGSGKTSIVNLCANFYFGAQNADDEKLFIVDPKTKTDRVTVYTFYPEGEDQIPLTVVDTPGLNDSTGAEIHDHVDALKSFLALACSQGMEINALAFVAQAHLVRLTSSEKLVMDYVRSLFGSEVEKHIMALVTFSDNQPTPPVIEAMEQYGFNSPFFVKFNNTLLISKSEAVDELDRIYWRTGMRSWKKCLKQLSFIDSLSHVAISSINKEVFNMSVLNKFSSSLEAELRNFITMCRKKKKMHEFYSDKELHLARKKVWMTSNDAYNVHMFAESKEIFLINSCQLHFENEPIPELSAVIKLFLLLDNESTLRCVLKKLVAVLVQCLKVFDKHPKAYENSLATFCNACNDFCYYRREYSDYRSSFRVVTFECKCSHSSGLHGPPPEDSNSPPLQFINNYQLFSLTAHSIKKEISKYDGMNSSVGSLWTVGQVLKNLQLNDPDEYGNKIINQIFIYLNNFKF